MKPGSTACQAVPFLLCCTVPLALGPLAPSELWVQQGRERTGPVSVWGVPIAAFLCRHRETCFRLVVGLSSFLVTLASVM